MLSKLESKPFVLTMLGTDTFFTPQLKNVKHSKEYKKTHVTDYPKGETLSVISRLIAAVNAVVSRDKKAPYPYQADEVTVVTGPVTQGSDVGEKIAYGLAASLNAIARGQTDINIIAHSRGAVESILIAHELNTVQRVISACATFDEVAKILKEEQEKRWAKKPKTNNTPDIIQSLMKQIALIPAEQRSAWFKNLKKNMPKASVDFFGIDPVPGDCFPITWYDERYFTLPAIMKKAQILYYENEHSNLGFTPICPKPETQEQQFVRDTIPGYHGTGSAGNNASQTKVVVAPEDTKTTHVQKLLIFKLLQMLQEKGVTFNKEEVLSLFAETRGLGRKYVKLIEGVQKGDLDPKDLDYPSILRSLYDKIASNKKGYEAYNNTSYPYMGVSPQRKVLLAGHTYGLLTDIFPSNTGYVNEEHARLMQEHFLHLFQLHEKPDNIVALVDTAREVLAKNIKAMATEAVDLASSFIMIDAKPTTLKKSKEAREDVLNTVNSVIQHISQHYLTNDWSSTEKQAEKKELFAAVIKIFTTFDELSTLPDNEDIIRPFVSRLQKLGADGIIETVKQQLAAMENGVNYLQATEDARLKHYYSGLLKSLLAQEQNVHDENIESAKVTHLIDEIMSQEEFKNLEPNLESKTAFITNQLVLQKKLALPGKSPAEIQEQILADFKTQYNDSTIEEFVTLYTQMQTLIQDLAALRAVIPGKKADLDSCELSLLQKSQSLLSTAAQKFYKDKPLEALPALAPKGSFIDQAEQYAIVHYGLVDRRQQAYEAVRRERDLHAAEIEDLQEKITTQEEQLQNKDKELQHRDEQINLYVTGLNDEKEANFLLLINQKLKPLTLDYQKLLQADKSADPVKDQKLNVVADLLVVLNNTQDYPLPSQRVTEFYTKLNDAALSDQLKAHRDPAWQRYLKNAVLIAGILISGIVPGLLALTAYVKMGNSTGKSHYFWRSTGDVVVEQLKDEILDNDPSKSNP